MNSILVGQSAGNRQARCSRTACRAAAAALGVALLVTPFALAQAQSIASAPPAATPAGAQAHARPRMTKAVTPAPNMSEAEAAEAARYVPGSDIEPAGTETSRQLNESAPTARPVSTATGAR